MKPDAKVTAGVMVSVNAALLPGEIVKGPLTVTVHRCSENGVIENVSGPHAVLSMLRTLIWYDTVVPDSTGGGDDRGMSICGGWRLQPVGLVRLTVYASEPRAD